MVIKFQKNLFQGEQEVSKIPEGQLMVKVDFGQNYLKYHLHKTMAGETTPRHHNVVHASDLDPQRDYCPREGALLTIHNKKRPSGFASTANRVTWDFGYAGADLVINNLPPNMAWGNWKCPACKNDFKLQYRPTACKCGVKGKDLRYREIFMRDPETEVVGSCDLLVDLLGNGKLTLYELKTEGAEGFKARNKATLDHEWRTKLYLYLAARSNGVPTERINLDEARIMYICKSGYAKDHSVKKWILPDWGMSPFKEYKTKRDDDAVKDRMGLASMYRSWRRDYDNQQITGALNLPPRIASCSSGGCTRAKNCPTKKECWS